ncbi:MAG: hypothetical protein EPN93_17335 [Spirochaetes bacterium]|nr:MAG: hypothetical protein EPN93_17335 [Spirochaetota bacterium]
MALQNELVKKLGFELPEKIIDDDTGETLPGDPEKIGRALGIIARVQNELLLMTELINEFFGDKLYLYLGLTREDAARVCFGMSLSTVQQIERIGKTFGGRLAEFAHLGVSRLDMISRLTEDQKKEILDNKVLTLADGSQITVDEIGAVKVKEVEKALRAEKLKHSKLKTNFEELKEEHESEVNALKNELTDVNKMLNFPVEEKEFHKRISRTREARSKVMEAQANIHAAFMRLAQITIDDANKDVLADIEGFAIVTARHLLDLESVHGGMLGPYRDGVKAIAGARR